ncbi:hypothetical protein glysoja_048453, partial [Glycine soja]
FDPRDISKALDHVLEKRLTFMFKVVPGNTCHFVSQLSQDEALINSIVAKLPTFDLQQCFSATAESNPLLSGSITPAKHNLVLSNTQLDDIPFEDLSSIQLSSIGVTKHIKIE